VDLATRRGKWTAIVPNRQVHWFDIAATDVKHSWTLKYLLTSALNHDSAIGRGHGNADSQWICGDVWVGKSLPEQGSKIRTDKLAIIGWSKMKR
jgi:hypothetical protein